MSEIRYGDPTPRKAKSAQGKGDAILNASQVLDDLLVDGEQVLRRGSVAPQYLSYLMWLYLVASIIGLFVCFGIYVPFLWAHWVYMKRIRWYITDRRLLHVSGLFSLKTEEMSFRRIGEANLVQGIFSRLFNTGTVVVNDIGTNRITIPFINDPLSVKKLLSEKAYEDR
jgi:uncharacterized membrane protein YdbT with pleckstrin-like domain